MKLKTLIIDDEPIALEKLGTYVSKVPFLELVAACSSALDAIDILSENTVDLIFTDISMPDLDGMAFVKTLSAVPMVVFITAYQQYAVESYRVSAIDYILKPYEFGDIQRAANKALDFAVLHNRKATLNDATSLFVKTDYKFVRVNFADILYIKGYGEYLQIYVSDNKIPILTLSSFAAIMQQLPDYFIQIHRSYVININKIDKIERGVVSIGNDITIPIGNSFKSEFQELLQRYSVGKV